MITNRVRNEKYFIQKLWTKWLNSSVRYLLKLIDPLTYMTGFFVSPESMQNKRLCRMPPAHAYFK